MSISFPLISLSALSPFPAHTRALLFLTVQFLFPCLPAYLFGSFALSFHLLVIASHSVAGESLQAYLENVTALHQLHVLPAWVTFGSACGITRRHGKTVGARQPDDRSEGTNRRKSEPQGSEKVKLRTRASAKKRQAKSKTARVYPARRKRKRESRRERDRRRRRRLRVMK